MRAVCAGSCMEYSIHMATQQRFKAGSKATQHQPSLNPINSRTAPGYLNSTTYYAINIIVYYIISELLQILGNPLILM